METGEFFTAEEKRLLFVLYRKLLQLSGETLHKGDCRKLKTHLVNSIQNNRIQRDIFGLNPIIKDMQTAVIVAEEIGMKRASILGLMLHDSVRCGTCTAEAGAMRSCSAWLPMPSMPARWRRIWLPAACTISWPCTGRTASVPV